MLAAIVARIGDIAPAAADDAPIVVPSDVFDDASDAVLPAPPPGARTVRRNRVEYVVPAHYVDDVDALERTRRTSQTRIEDDLGVALDDDVRIRIGRNEDEMRAMAPIGMPPPSYASGVAYPPLGLVLLTLTTRNPGEPVPDVHRVLTHELSHVALHRAAGGRPIPRWFSEGMAVYHANEFGLDRIEILWSAASSSRLLPLVRLTEGFADGSDRVDIAYAQSADVLGFLLRQPHGQDKMRRMLGRIREGASFEAALEHAFFFDIAGLEEAWRHDLGERHSAYPLVLGGGGMWAVFLVVLAFGYARKRRQSKKKLSQWENEEAAMASLEAELDRKLRAHEEAVRARRGGPPRTLH